MSSASLLAVATKGSIASSALLLAVGLLVLGMAAALLRAAAREGEARSRAEVGGQLRALDELVTRGLISPEDYATRQAALLNEI